MNKKAQGATLGKHMKNQPTRTHMDRKYETANVDYFIRE